MMHFSDSVQSSSEIVLVSSSIFFTSLEYRCIESKTDLVRQGDTFYSNPPHPHLTTILVGHAGFSLLYVTLVEMSVVGRVTASCSFPHLSRCVPFLITPRRKIGLIN